MSRIDPALGALLSEADVRRLDPPGWKLPNPTFVSLQQPAELLVQAPGHDRGWILLSSEATFDDFDVRFAFRLLWGDTTTTHVGLCLRESDDGEYQAVVSTQATCSFADSPTHGERRRLVPWTQYSAVRTEPGAPNELRVVCVGDRIKMLVNGVQVAAVRDSARHYGKIQVLSSSRVPMAFAITALSVWQPSLAERGAGPAPVPVGAVCAVWLEESGSSKILVIKVVRESTGLGLKESKDLVDAAPAVVKSGLSREAGEVLRRALEAAGARVSVR